MKHFAMLLLLLAFISSGSLLAELDTQFLQRNKLIFEADFDDGNMPVKPYWRFRRTKGEIVDGSVSDKTGGKLLKVSNDGGNGAFVRLHSTQTKGPLPENFIMSFDFKVVLDKNVTPKRKPHPVYSTGNRFSFGHYDAKFNWKGAGGMIMNIGHGVAMKDNQFHIKRETWYHALVEIKDGAVLATISDRQSESASYFMQHEHVKDRPQGYEYFVHVTEFGFLDNVKVWSIKSGEKSGWKQVLSQLKKKKLAFLQSENPGFSPDKQKK